MDFDVPPETREFAAEVDEVLRGPQTMRLLQDVLERRDGMDGDVRDLYRHLGRAGILAPSWPVEYGGRASDFTAIVTLLEKLVTYRIPQNLFCISVLNVGSLILAAGSEQQRKTLLPAMARMDITVCILFTEPEHGSDLAGITTTAIRDGAGWVINGRKTYNLKSAYADLALCAVRTDMQSSQYEGISLFLVPLDSPGVVIRPLPSLANEQFHDIWFTDVHVEEGALGRSRSPGATGRRSRTCESSSGTGVRRLLREGGGWPASPSAMAAMDPQDVQRWVAWLRGTFSQRARFPSVNQVSGYRTCCSNQIFC